MMLTADEVSRLYSERIFDLTGATPRKRKIVCPLPMHQHQNYTPSFSIFWVDGRWRWRCHGNCNLQGDVIDLVGYISVPGYSPNEGDSLSKAINILTDNREIPEPVEPPKIQKTGLSPTDWKNYPLGETVRIYAEERGLKEETLHKFRIGEHQGNRSTWMTIPTFEDGRLKGIKMRNTHNGLRYKALKGSRTGLFNHDAVKYSTDKVFVVKGEIAAMILDQYGLLACAPSGGESMSVSQYKSILSLADVVVIGDNDYDPRVRENTRQLAKDRADELNARLFFPPNKYKDVDEWILDDPEALQVLREV